MCQLLGMNCNTPTDIVFSFEGFRRRAGLTDCHSDGFGIAFFEGRGVRIFRDNHAASQSPIADCVKQYKIKSLNVIAHIRKEVESGRVFQLLTFDDRPKDTPGVINRIRRHRSE